MPVFRNKRHWESLPYHPVVDALRVGDVVEWGSRGKMRTVRNVIRNTKTDHVYMVECVKLCRSQYPGPMTLLDRHQLIKNVRGIIAEKIRLNKTDLEARLTTCLTNYNEGWRLWHENSKEFDQPERLDRCITQWETVGILY